MHSPTRRKLIQAGVGLAGLGAAGITLPWFFRPQLPQFDENVSGWVEPNTPLSPELNGRLSCDVAIVGAGYTGLSTALHLAKQDPTRRIVVIEARQPGHGASGRNGGMVLPQFGESMYEMPDKPDDLRQAYSLTHRAMRSMERLAKADGKDCGLALNGYCVAILDEAELGYYRKYVRLANGMGIPLEFWDEDTTEEELGSPEFAGAVYDPHGGQVHAMRWLQVIRRAAEHAGVRIYGNSPVTRIEEGKVTRLIVGNHRAVVEAEKLVLATNGYTPALGYFKNNVMPVHAPTGLTSPLSDDQLAAMAWGSRLPFFDTRNFLYHLILRKDRRLIVGGGNARYEQRGNLIFQGDHAQNAKMMLADLQALYPKLQGLRFEKVWTGVMGITLDGREGIGVCGEHGNIYYALGYNGHGITLSFLFGETLAHLMHGKTHPLQETGLVNQPMAYIPPDPYRWIGAQAAMAHLEWQDRRK